MSASFYHRVPEEITVNRNWSCRDDEPENAWKNPYLVQPATVESVTQALVRGPFVAMSAVGPSCYSQAPRSLRRQIPDHPEVSVYGWTPGAKRISTQYVPIIICGVQRKGGKEHLYYVLAEDVSQDPKQAIGKFAPSSIDKNIYVTSMNTFARYEFDMFPPVTEEEIVKNQDQLALPTPFAGRPDLFALWEKGEIKVTFM